MYRLEVINDFFVLLAVLMSNVILVLEPVIDEPTTAGLEEGEDPAEEQEDLFKYIEGPIFD